MKMKIHRLTVLMMILCLAIGTMAVNVYAYDHKVSVSAGNGEFSDGDVLVTGENITVSATVNGTEVKVNGDTAATISKMPDKKAPADSKYFVKGLKEAGHNDPNVGDITVESNDAEFVVAYGLKSNMVKFIVHYRDAATGGPVPGLPESEEFVGVTGDKPVITWKYAEGYLPQAYRLTGELSGEKEFTFWYYKVDAQGNIVTVVDGAPAGAAAAAAAAAGGPDGAGVAIGDADTPLADGPQDTVDIDNNQSPTTDPSNIDDNKTPGANWGLIGGGAALVAAIAAAIAILAKRRREEEEEEV